MRGRPETATANLRDGVCGCGSRRCFIDGLARARRPAGALDRAGVSAQGRRFHQARRAAGGRRLARRCAPRRRRGSRRIFRATRRRSMGSRGWPAEPPGDNTPTNQGPAPKPCPSTGLQVAKRAAIWDYGNMVLRNVPYHNEDDDRNARRSPPACQDRGGATRQQAQGPDRTGAATCA